MSNKVLRPNSWTVKTGSENLYRLDQLVGPVCERLLEKPGESTTAGRFFPKTIDKKTQSPIEDIFLETALKYLREEVTLHNQYEVSATFPCLPSTIFLLDFLTESKGRKIGFECDGRDYHHYFKDRLRDKIILASSDVKVVFRLTGSGLWHFTNDCFYLLSRLTPDVFAERSREVLWVLASGASRQVRMTECSDILSVDCEFKDEEDEVREHNLVLTWCDNLWWYEGEKEFFDWLRTCKMKMTMEDLYPLYMRSLKRIAA